MKRFIFLPLVAFVLLACDTNDYKRCNYVRIAGGASYENSEPIIYKFARYKFSGELGESYQNYNLGGNEVIVRMSYQSNAKEKPAFANSATFEDSSTKFILVKELGSLKSYNNVYYSLSKRSVKYHVAQYVSNKISKENKKLINDYYSMTGYISAGGKMYINNPNYYYNDPQIKSKDDVVYTDVGSGASVTYQLYTKPETN